MEPNNANSAPITVMEGNRIYSSCTHPLRDLIVIGDDQNNVAFWDAKEFKLLRKVSDAESKNHHVSALSFTPNGIYLIAASTDRYLRFYLLTQEARGLNTLLLKTTSQQTNPVSLIKVVKDPKDKLGYLVFAAENDSKSSHHKIVVFSLIPQGLSPELVSVSASEFAHFDAPILSIAFIQATNELIIGLSDGQLTAIKLPENPLEMPRRRSLALSCKGLSLINSEEAITLINKLEAEVDDQQSRIGVGLEEQLRLQIAALRDHTRPDCEVAIIPNFFLRTCK